MIIPTAQQTLMCFILCQSLTSFYLSVDLVRLDRRTQNIVILAGEEIQIQIYPNGRWRFEV
ncbi:DUF6888 family protein [Phormidesmis priestleyi]